MDITIIIALCALFVTVTGGFLSLAKFTDNRITRTENRLSASIGAVDSRLTLVEGHMRADHDRLEERVFRLAAGWPQEPRDRNPNAPSKDNVAALR